MANVFFFFLFYVQICCSSCISMQVKYNLSCLKISTPVVEQQCNENSKSIREYQDYNVLAIARIPDLPYTRIKILFKLMVRKKKRNIILYVRNISADHLKATVDQVVTLYQSLSQ